MRIGVFDSGIGGEAVAQALRLQFPSAEIYTVNDKENVPYGSKTTDEITRLTDAAIQPLLLRDCDVIVIACNSATTAAIGTLRGRYPEQFFIGIEPMIKTAAMQTKTGVVAICATPATLQSARYEELKSAYGSKLVYIEPDCSDWASLIESNTIAREHIDEIVLGATAKNADVIVLGCTHYHWIKEEIRVAADGNVTVLEPSDAIGRRVKEILQL